jgi:hypothetical protein
LQHLDCKWLKTSLPHQNTPSARETASVQGLFEGKNALLAHTPSVLRKYTLTVNDSSLLFCSKTKEDYEDTLLAVVPENSSQLIPLTL